MTDLMKAQSPTSIAIWAVVTLVTVVMAGALVLYALTPGRGNVWPSIGQWAVGYGPLVALTFLGWLRGEKIGRSVSDVQLSLNGTLDDRIRGIMKDVVQGASPSVELGPTGALDSPATAVSGPAVSQGGVSP